MAMFANSKTTVSRAEASFLNGPEPPKGGEWVTATNQKCKGGCCCNDTDSPNFDQLRLLVGKAFAGTIEIPGEPSLDKAFEDMSIPQDVKEEAILFLFSIVVKNSLANGGVAFCYKPDDDNDDDKCVESLGGVVIIREYDSEKQAQKFHRLATKLGDKLRGFSIVLCKYLFKRGQPMPLLFTDPQYKRQSEFFKQWETVVDQEIIPWHASYGPKHKHWYVEIVGTHPHQRGRGVGGRLMTRVGQLADEQNMDCYLECSPENVGFYERFGYHQVAAKLMKKLDPSLTYQATLCLMQRPASPGKNGGK